MAANVHVVSHMLAAENRGAHVDPLAHHGHNHDHHHHDRIDLGDPDSENRLSDCAIYHAYVGMGGLLPVHCTSVTVSLPPLAVSQPLGPTVADASVETQPIRGPPSYS